MLIIGHRGAAGLDTENTLKSIEKAVSLGVDMIEFDVWTTKDGVPVLSHDSNLVRLTGKNAQIFDLTYRQISRLRTKDGQKIPAAEEALKACGDTAVLLEIKDFYLSKGILNALSKFKEKSIAITTFNHSLLPELQKKRPDLKLYAASNLHPFAAINFAKTHRLAGVTLNYKSFTLPAYWYAKRFNLDINLFTVDNPNYLRLLKALGLGVNLITNYPDRVLAIIRRKA